MIQTNILKYRGVRTINYINYYLSPLGQILLSSDGENLNGLWFENEKYYPYNISKGSEKKDLPIFEQTKKWLDIYFAGNNPNFTPSLNLRGTEFQMSVWNILNQIPYGEVTTYGEIAREIAKQKGIVRMSAQAVGGAVGRNPISIIVPCHRVVGSNGALTGYAGGLKRKSALLSLEKILI